MSKIQNRFEELLARKMRRENRRITQVEVSQITGLSTQTISAYALNTVTRYDGNTLRIFCEYFDCSVGDFLILEDTEEKEKMAAALV